MSEKAQLPPGFPSPAALRDRQIDIPSLIDGVFPLEQIETALERARTEAVLKFLLAIDDGISRPKA